MDVKQFPKTDKIAFSILTCGEVERGKRILEIAKRIKTASWLDTTSAKGRLLIAIDIQPFYVEKVMGFEASRIETAEGTILLNFTWNSR